MEQMLSPQQCFVQPQDPLDPTGAVQSTLLLPGQTLLPTQGMHEQYLRNTKTCVDFVMAHPTWRLGVQLHKLVQMP